MTEYESLHDLKQILRRFVDDKGLNAPCVVAINKCDLFHHCVVDIREVNEIVENFGLTDYKIMETSAKTGKNIEELVEECVRMFWERLGDVKSVVEQVLLLDQDEKDDRMSIYKMVFIPLCFLWNLIL